MNPSPNLLAIVGPTASGKGTLSRALNRILDAELLSVDSMKVYRGMDIGTAKPTKAMRTAHAYHLLDLVDPRESYSVADYLQAAARCEAEVLARGCVALFVGGTALYLKALRHGLFADPGLDLEYRKALAARADRAGTAALHLELKRVDPEAAARIHPNDRKRLIRALEVLRTTGRPISDHQTQFKGEGRAVRWVGLRWSREDLIGRIDARVNRMMETGFLEEVRRLEEAHAFGETSGEGIGYRELRAHLRREISLDEAVDATRLRTRQFARRQATWFRSFQDIHWLDMKAGDDPEARAEEALAVLTRTA